jgi:hypothetical protein
MDELVATTLALSGAKALEIGPRLPAKKVSRQASKNAARRPESASFGVGRVKNHMREYLMNGILESNSASAAHAGPVSRGLSAPMALHAAGEAG